MRVRPPRACVSQDAVVGLGGCRVVVEAMGAPVHSLDMYAACMRLAAGLCETR